MQAEDPIIMRTHAIIFRERGVIAHADVELPEPQPDHLVVETLFTFVSSGTETRVLQGHYGAEGNYPLIPGYACVGRVVQAGPKAAGYRLGDVISFSPCTDPASAPIGIRQQWGGQCSHHLIHANTHPVVLPVGCDPLRFVASQVAAISLRGVRMATPRPGEVAVVIGLGVIGASSAAWLKAAGCRVIGTDLAAARCRRAAAGWVDAAVCGSEPDAEARLLALCAGVGADIVVEASGSVPGAQLAHRLVRCTPTAFYHPDNIDELRWPRLVYQANYLSPVPITPSAWMPGEGAICITPRDRNLDDRRRSVHGIAAGTIDGRALVDRVAPVSEAAQCYRDLLERPDDLFSVAFSWT